ncbi:ATP synthase F0 subunit 8 (mitochondrion) [Amphibalanus amphitrite]|uniref:ATP synthase F0 subunit 8 n=1 Tax=Amphibalanus amphitrite TaxID=1232801 RepID=A0A067YBR0_AMPAM|nr:ATP synthase F0 subunit 8 [Amphibalanus amphitrite]AGZ78475.1 ATP synthase F0 subunit 8 [Amphibalanus amphitrite]
MPHMSPIFWALIMVMTFSMILILLSMIYFSNSPSTPDSSKITKSSVSFNWMW